MTVLDDRASADGASPADNTPTVSWRRPPRAVVRWGAKLGSAVLVLWAAASITFLLQVIAPGDRATLLLNLSSGLSRERTPD